MNQIRRIGDSQRWSDVVIHQNVAEWVEVATDMTADAAGQVQQVLRQIDETLLQLKSTKAQLLKVVVFLSDLQHINELNAQWDQWVLKGQAPIRACVGTTLGKACLVEMIITAAVPPVDIQ
ncbi:MAG: RidA family protein [Planctomyces sp.]|nr:RidA family protein [Planctomyces sp.]